MINPEIIPRLDPSVDCFGRVSIPEEYYLQHTQGVDSVVIVDIVNNVGFPWSFYFLQLCFNYTFQVYFLVVRY